MHLITKDMILDLEWLIPASYLMSPENFKPLLIKEIKRVLFSKEKAKGSGLDSFLIYKEKLYYSLLKNAGIKEEDIFKPPQKNDPNAHFYCPFCMAEFVEGIKICPDCDIAVEMYTDIPTMKK